MYTVGSDPEFVILDKDGTPVLAHTLDIPPPTSKVRGEYGFYFRDGANVEINALPDMCRALHINRVGRAINAVNRCIAPYRLAPLAAYPVTQAMLDSAPLDVVAFGCNPAFDAYNGGAPKIVEVDPATHLWRYTSGHLHLSTPAARAENPVEALNPLNLPDFIRVLDLYLGVALAYLIDGPEQWQRRRVYGQAGEYRPQTYSTHQIGVEYRVPPSEMWAHPAIASFATGLMRDCARKFDSLRRALDPKMDDDVRAAINTGEGAEALIRTDRLISPALLKTVKQQTIHPVHPTTTLRKNFSLLSSIDAHFGWADYCHHRWERIPPNMAPSICA
jgi:hypothetical protein